MVQIGTKTGFRFSFYLSESNLVQMSSTIFALKKAIPRRVAVGARSIFLSFVPANIRIQTIWIN